MTRPTFFLAALPLAALLAAGCGDDTTAPPDIGADTSADTAGADTSADTAGADTTPADGHGTDGSDDTSPTDTSATDTASDGSTTDGTATTDGSTTSDTTEPEPPVNTASVTVNGATTEVTPAVRRGALNASPVEAISSVGIGNSNVLTCEGESGPAAGGRAIRVMDVSISGSFAANCGGPSNFDLGEENMLFTASQACSGRVGSCTVDLNENFETRFVGCSHTAAAFTVSYQCAPLIPAPSFVLEVPTSFGNLRVDALDGLGEMGCVQRAAVAYLDGQLLNVDAAQPCRITIDRRGPTTLEGSIEATLLVDGASVPLGITFASNQTVNRNAIQVFLSDDFCFTTDVTPSVTTEGEDTFDVYTGGAFTCLQQPQRTPSPITVAIRRPRSGETWSPSEHNGRVRLNDAELVSTADLRGTFHSIDHAETRERFAAYDVAFCDVSGATPVCGQSIPVVYFQSSR